MADRHAEKLGWGGLGWLRGRAPANTGRSSSPACLLRKALGGGVSYCGCHISVGNGLRLL